MDQVTFPIRVFTLLGVDTVVCESEIWLLRTSLRENIPTVIRGRQ